MSFKRLFTLLNPNKTYATASFYPDFIRVYIPNEPYENERSGRKKIKKPENSSKVLDPEDFERSVRRSKKAIRDYALCNHFELFATFTFAEDRYDIDKCKNKMANWLKNQQNRSGTFKYLIVSEFHKDKALHFHALIKGFTGKLKESRSTKTNKLLTKNSRQIYEIPSFTSGFTNVRKIEQTSESRSKTANYLTKYVTKDMPLFFNKNRFWSSKGLKKPEIENNPEKWYEIHEPSHEIQISMGKILYFKNDSFINLIRGKK